MTERRVNDLAFLSDSQTAAIVDDAGSVDWWSLPRFDGPAVFARLLDPRGGHFAIRPAEPFTATRRYLPGTLVLETTFTTDTGTARLTEALAFEPGTRDHDIGKRVPRALVRTVEGIGGPVAMEVELCPRFEYGLTVPHFRKTEGGVVALAGPDELHLSTDLDVSLADGCAAADFRLTPGERRSFVLQHHRAFAPRADEEPNADRLLAETVEGWRSWSSAHDAYDGIEPELVRHGAVVIRGLTYEPSGGVIAAATTSLPEIVGGSWNWDYRYVWLRDLALTMRALWVAACPAEASRHFELIWRALGDDPRHPVQIMIGVTGERDLSERELPHLAGFRDSRPVRAGNAAWNQRQFDVLGEVIDAVDLLRAELAEPSHEIRRLVRDLADQAARRWREPDAGMWEARDAERHYTSSKVMRWVALDRAIALADWLGEGADVTAWRRAREELHADVLEQAWDEEVGAFTGAYGSDQLDASVLVMPIFGFIRADDPRMRATIATIRRELAEGPHVHRWADDPNGFILCGYWLAQCLHLLGDRAAARQHFDALSALANDVGLLAEMADPATGELIGNIPQAFSHVGLINTAWRLTDRA